VDGFGEVVREARERLGLTQEELANLVQERVSVIKKVECGSLRPPLSLARNLEKVLKVRIIKELKDEDIHITPPPSVSRRLTLGDLLSGDKKE
jgi:putative transcription factor